MAQNSLPISVAQNLISSGVANLSVDTVALLFTLAVLWEMERRLTTASASWDAGATGHGTPSGLRWTQRCAKSWVRARETGDQAPDVRARELRLTARPGTGSIGRLFLHDDRGTPVRLTLRVIVIHCHHRVAFHAYVRERRIRPQCHDRYLARLDCWHLRCHRHRHLYDLGRIGDILLRIDPIARDRRRLITKRGHHPRVRRDAQSACRHAVGTQAQRPRQGRDALSTPTLVQRVTGYFRK